jgi:hypothetical protein
MPNAHIQVVGAHCRREADSLSFARFDLDTYLMDLALPNLVMQLRGQYVLIETSKSRSMRLRITWELITSPEKS